MRFYMSYHFSSTTQKIAFYSFRIAMFFLNNPDI